jgi:hypothetical protein
MQTLQSERSLRRELQYAQGFSVWALLLAVLGSVAGTIFTSAFGTGHWGTLAGAAVGPVIGTTFSTKHTGERGRVRNAIIIILSIGALLITVTGFTLADRVAGKSILPGPDPQAGTFFGPASQPSSTASVTPSSGSKPNGPAIQVQPSGPLDCGAAAVGAATACPQAITITSAGTGALRITSVVMAGSDMQDFIPSQDCVGISLDLSQTCDLKVSFQPTAAGPRQATLVIHQNIPWPDKGTTITLTGNGTGTDGGSGGNSSARFNLVASPDNASCNYIPNGALGGADELSVDFYFLIIDGKPSDVPGGLSVTGSSNTGLYTHYYTSPNNQALSVAQFALRPGDFGVLHTIKITVDSANQVEETSESDNTIVVSVLLPSPRPTSTIDPLACTISRG